MVSLFTSVNITAQNNVFTFQLNNAVNECVFYSLLDRNGNAVFVGETSDSAEYGGYSINPRPFIFRITPNGDTLRKYFNFGQKKVFFSGISLMPDNNFLVPVGVRKTNPNDSCELILMKLDSNYDIMWQKSYKFKQGVGFYLSPIFFPNGDFYAFGGIDYGDVPQTNVCVLKFNQYGDLLNLMTHIDSVGAQEIEGVLVKDDSSGFYVFGKAFLHPFPIITHYTYVMEIDTQLNVDTIYGLLPKYILRRVDVKPYKPNQFLLSCATYASFYQNIAVFKYNKQTFDTLGYRNFIKSDTTSQTAITKSLDFYSPNYIYLTGWYELPGIHFETGPTWPVLIGMDSNFNIRFKKYFYDGENYNAVSTICATQDNGCILVIFSYNLNSNNLYNSIFAKFDSLGNSTLNIKEDLGFKVFDNLVYPNPGHDVLYINIAPQVLHMIQKNIAFRFSVYNADGKLVEQRKIIQENFNVTTSHWPKGTYLYTINGSNGYMESGKWIKQ